MKSELTQQEFEDRTKRLLIEEAKQPLKWFYCSFASDRFLGAAIIEAHGILDCAIFTHALGINPGGEMAAFDLTPEQLPSEQYRNRLLSKDDILKFWPDAKSIKDWEAEET